jgi:hypothetical protein
LRCHYLEDEGTELFGLKIWGTPWQPWFYSVGLPAAEAARRLRTALDPEGDWIAQVLRDADARLTDLRAGPHPDAGGLVVAIDMEHADRLAERLARVSGERPLIVTSETEGASDRIARFAAGAGRWLVSVLMVSEGVDVPRLRVGVYATTARTELFFRQVVGRFVRRTPMPNEQMSHLFLASDPRLKQLATQIEEERNHALEQQAEGEAVADQRERAEASEAFRALWSSARRDDDVLRTTEPGEALQLFADAAPAPAAALAAFTTTAPAPASRHDRREQLRDERRALVAAVSRRTGEPHRTIHGRINRETGAASVTAASVEQLERGNRLLERQASKRR